MKFLLIIISLTYYSYSVLATDDKIELNLEKKIGFYAGIKTNNIINIDVNGLVCDFCAQAIEKVFMKRDEVKGIMINLENQKVIIYLSKKRNIENNILLEIFEDAGYTVEKINRSI